MYKLLKIMVNYYNKMLREKPVRDGIPFDYDKMIWLFKYRLEKMNGHEVANAYNKISRRCKVVCIKPSSDISKCEWQRLPKEATP